MAAVPGFAFITGGGSGIGKASSILFAKSGARGLVVADIDIEAAKRTAHEAAMASTNPGFKAEALHIDVTDEASVKAAISRAAQISGRIDYCLHSAGTAGHTFYPVSDADVADFKRVMDVNVNGTLFVDSAMCKAMAGQELKPSDEAFPERGTTRGSIINMASVTSHLAPPGMVHYTASKSAVLGITKTAAIDHIANGIRVNCVCPSWTDTNMLNTSRQSIPDLDTALLGAIPMGRLGTAEEVAASVLFLASSSSRFMTGTSIIMDGGASLKT